MPPIRITQADATADPEADTFVAAADTIAVMTKANLVPIHARVDEEDLKLVDAAADDGMVTRSQMIAMILREWAKPRRPVEPKAKGGKAKQKRRR